MKNCYLLITMLCACVAAHAQGDFSVSAVTPMEYQVPGTKNFNVTIRNVGSGGLGSCNIYWQQDNGTVKSVTKSASQIVWGGTSGIIKDPAFQVNFPAAGMYTLKVWIKTITPSDMNPANDTLKMNINVMQTLPKKNVVLEVYKHQTCGPCYDAAIYNDTGVSKNSNYAIVSIYTSTSDIFYNADGATVNTHFNFAHPAPLFDRFWFPYQSGIATSYYTGMGGYQLSAYGDREQFYEPVGVWFKSVTFNATTRELKATVSAAFFDKLTGDYRFNLYLTEDDLKGYQAEAPDPNNFIHKHVLRAMLGGPWGKQGSLPATINQNDVKDYEFTYIIPAAYNIAKMHLVAMVQQYSTDDKKIRILNSAHKSFGQAVSVADGTQALSAMQVYPNPATSSIKVALPSGNHRLQITDVTGKVYVSSQATGNTQVDVHMLPAGTYLLYADDGNIVRVEKFVIQ